ncbi:hypothetical protein CVT25_002369 [Psilocybe cyanescens]|uniref:Ras-GAP domain-containing protein n=1 Tax=Psilocybe cyanescens TaxID=93625 RepID=A0A409WKA0_PSICY|nr:hypothetical protein CVT25_002369 [Psilocybe cyanescens]
MPRRPSASVGPSHASTPNASAVLIHRTTESHHVIPSAPASSIHSSHYTPQLQVQGSATPQQKIVQVLVKRLKDKLPCNSGLSLDRVEHDQPTQQAIETLMDLSKDSLDMIAWALCELLDRLAKQFEPHTQQLTIEVLQSQLFILKVLSMTMASRWSHHPRANDDRPLSSPDSPVPPGSSKSSRRQAPSEYSINQSWQEPPPLDDACVKYILSVMVLFMRQTASPDVPLMFQTRSTDIAFRDFEDVNMYTMNHVETPPPTTSEIPLRNQPSSNSVMSNKVSLASTTHIAATNTTYESTHMSLVKSSTSVNNLIAKYIGRIIFHISASNWIVVFERLSSKIAWLAGHSEQPSDLVDLQLLSHSVMDRQRLVQVLTQLSSLLVTLRQDAKEAVTIHLRSAVWNWIDVFPAEFNDTIRTRGRTEGTPERVFDVLYSIAPLGMTPDYQFGSSNHKSKKELKFIDAIVKNVGNNSKLSEVSLTCLVDLCRAAAYVDPQGDVPLRLIAPDVAHEIKVTLYNCGATRRPFWESYEDIDVSLYADALVALYRFLPLEDSTPLFEACMEPERSEPVKTCAIRACLTLVQDAPRFPWQRPLTVLEDALAGRCRDILKGSGVRRQEVEHNGVMKRISTRPRAKHVFPEPLNDREVLILGILSLWRATPLFMMKGLSSTADADSWVNMAVKLWEAPIDISVKVSTASCMRRLSQQAFLTFSDDSNRALLMNIVKSSLPITLLSVSANLLTTRSDFDAQRLWISVAHQIIEAFVIKTDFQHTTDVQPDPKRIPAFALAEMAFLVSLTSADNDISQLAAKGLRLLSYAERLPGAPVNTSMTEEDRSKRNLIYEQLGDPRITVAGRVGHQKRIRKLVRMLTFSAGIHVVLWEECYWRWRALNESINNAINEAAASLDGEAARKGSMTSAQNEIRSQWHNLTLFLAALGGTCLQEGQDLSSLSKVISNKYLPDKMRVVQNPISLVETFIGDLINLLVADDAAIRDYVREALGSELCPRLYSKMIRNIEETLQTLAEKADPSDRDNESVVVLLDQVLSILKLVSDNPEVTLEDIMNVEINPTMQLLLNFTCRSSGPSAHRLKIKFCALCESLCSRADNLTLRKDSSVRHDILDQLLGVWMVSPKAMMDHPNPSAANELNMACLRAVVKLLDRLQLKASDASNTGDDTVHVVSRLFNKYSTALLDSIEICQSDNTTSDAVSEIGSIHQKMRASQKEAELRELVITGLTHLVSANSESGFKQCLPLAYDQDNRKRSIFAHVFARVIGQGTVFDPEDKTVTKARHMSLCELVRSPDMVLAMTICETCPPGEVEMMISVLLNVFDSRSALMNLIKLMIEREVQQTGEDLLEQSHLSFSCVVDLDNEASLFRSNSTCTRFLSAFAKLHGYQYLRSLVQPLLDTMVQMPPGTGYEIDPTKAIGQDVALNQRNVEYVASTFLQLMSSSLPALPGMFREICAHIAKTVAEVWPEAKYAAMGAFIFLRFISPAVVTPETIDIEVPKGENAIILRRGLMVIAKIIQNLANNIFFGKEAHMTILNKFLESNIANVTRFLSELHKYSASSDEINDHWLGTTSDDTDVVVLHRFFHKHADKIGKELLSLSKPSTDGDASAINGKRAWDGLCALLVDLGPPMDVPRLATSDCTQHREYLELMSKMANRDTRSIEELFLETDVHESTAVFILRLSKINVENLDIELFMYHILKTLSSNLYRARQFDLVLDCTGFSSISEVPLQWLKYCAELIPSDIRSRFSATRILSPNALTQKYLRRLYNISAGTPLCSEIKAYTSVLQLMEDVRTAALAPLAYPVSLEQEVHDTFFDVMMRTSSRVPVVMRVGTSHIRVTSVKSLPISPGLSCKSTELIPLTDVSDIYNVSTGQEANEFIIRRRQGVTVYFSSPNREQIVKCIRACKGKLKEAQAPLTERFSRFSNVPATLLHIGFLSVDLNDEELRGAAYDLLGAVCKYLKYDKSPIIASKAGFILGDPIAFVISLSEKLAEFAPQLTLDFIHEVSAAMTGMDKTSLSHRINCLQYMSPWIHNLSHFANATHPLYERSGARLRDCIRTLSDLSLAFPEITSTIQKQIWSEVAKLDSNIVDIILDELVRTATDGGIGTQRCETISHIVALLSSINVRGRIYSKLRKALSKVPPKFTNTLLEHPNWNEISTLIRLSLVVGSQSTHAGVNYLYVPELIHLVSLVAGEGPALVRKSVFGIIVNLLQSLYIARHDNGPEEQALMQLINDCSLPSTLKLFGLRRETPASEYINNDLINDKDILDNQERLVQFLIRILSITSGTPGLLNVWRARWMSLVTATAFQQSPAVQTRSFIALAALAVSEVDDDFLYQILVAFKSALTKANENNTMAIVSMLRCMCKIVPGIVDTSRYLCVLFWLAVALLEASHAGFYVEATSLLRITLENMEKQGLFKTSPVQTVLLESREQLEEVMSQLDELLRISFETNFSFSLAAIIFKGMRHSQLKESAELALRTLCRVTSRMNVDRESIANGFKDSPRPEVLGYVLALLPVSTTLSAYRRLLVDCHIEETWSSDSVDGDNQEIGVPTLNHSNLGIEDPNTALLVASFVGTILVSAQGDDAETEMLYGLLSSLANVYPEVIAITYETIQDRIKNTFATSSNASIIRSVSNIFRVASQDPVRSSNSTSHGSTSTLSVVEESSIGPGRSHLNALEELGMQGLANNFQFLPPNKGHATKMINWIPGLITLMIS